MHPSRLPILVLLLVLLLSACSLGAVTAGPDTTDGGPTGEANGPTEEPDEPDDPAVDATRHEVEALIPRAEELRGLRFLEPPNITIVDDAGLEARVREMLAEDMDPDELARDEAVYRLLGIHTGDQSLEDFFLDLYGEQVGGFYHPESGELVVPMSEEGLLVRERLVVVHELIHALTDQHFDFGTTMRQLDDASRFDAAAALQAVVEGDAVRAETAMIEALRPDELAALVAEYDRLDTTVFDAAPHYIREQLMFPYLRGREFLRVLGVDAAGIDDIYRNPPVSTEQILRPDRYRSGEEPLTVTIGTPVPEGYEVAELATLGEAALRALLGAAVAAPELEAAVDGWGGDTYRVLSNGDRVVWELHYMGDDADDMVEMARAFRRYLSRQASDASNWTVRSNGIKLVIVVTEDAEAFRTITAVLEGWEAIGRD